MNDELRVPTVPLVCEVVLADGRRWSGRVFLPAGALSHEGPTRAEEWMNEAHAFFPFVADGEERPFLLNKREVAVVSVEAAADAGDVVEGTDSLVSRIIVECAGERLEGSIVIEMPEGHARLLDYANRPEPFLTLRDGARHHLVQKKRITRILEIQED
jgi:hypothetical protein